MVIFVAENGEVVKKEPIITLKVFKIKCFSCMNFKILHVCPIYFCLMQCIFHLSSMPLVFNISICREMISVSETRKKKQTKQRK